MRKLIYVVVIILTSFTMVHAQKAKLSKKEEVAKRIAEKEEIFEFLQQKQFLVEVDRITGRYGVQTFVQPTTNFVFIDSSEAVIQWAFINQIGFNGLGGVTLEGRVSQYQLNEPRNYKRPVQLRMTIFGTALGTLDAWMEVTADLQTVIRLSSQWGHRFTVYGNLKAIEEQVIYKGITSF